MSITCYIENAATFDFDVEYALYIENVASLLSFTQWDFSFPSLLSYHLLLTQFTLFNPLFTISQNR